MRGGTASRGRKRCLCCLKVMDYDEYCPCLGENFSAEIRDKLHRQKQGRTRRPSPSEEPTDTPTLWGE